MLQSIRLEKYGYLVFLLPASLPWLSAVIGTTTGLWSVAVILTPFTFFVLIPIVDILIGKRTANPSIDAEQRIENEHFYRNLTLLCLPLYMAVVSFGLWVLATAPMSLIEMIMWTVSIGLIGGVLAINPAHELIHKSSRLERVAGGLLLSLVCYGSFKIEHIRGHHVHVATPYDGSSARLGESVYRFVLRSLWANPWRAFQIEQDSFRRRARVWRVWRSELAGWAALSLLWALACAIGVTHYMDIPAWLGLGYFLGQSLVAISLLEIINYIEHYGLERRLQTDVSGGVRYERVSLRHSWNSSFLFTNLMLFELQRHSDHHAYSGRRYPLLRHFNESPQLPAGYPTMVVLAALPPLWRRVMDRRVEAYRTT